MTSRVLRALGVIIALLAAADPSITSERRAKPDIALIAADSVRDSGLTARAARELAKHFTVIRAPFSLVGATVIVGDRLPPGADRLTAPVFAVVPDRSAPSLRLAAIDAPGRAPLDARVPVLATLHAIGARDRRIAVSLRVGGVEVDRVERAIAGDDEHLQVPLSFAPLAIGTTLLHVEGEFAGGRGSAGAGSAATGDAIVDVRETRYAVLFLDRRPSWMSTFVRRAVEGDPRFVVTSRVVTSRNVSTDAGHPPAALEDLASLALFDVIVIGAPEALGERDVAGLETFLRRRGGSVVLLMDRVASGAVDRLTYTRSWQTRKATTPVDIVFAASDTIGLRSTELAWPGTLPLGGELVGRVRSPVGSSPDARPVLWRSAVGAGQLVVSGALDAWHYRDPMMSAFDRVWLGVIADAAAAAQRPIDVSLAAPLLAPGERTDVTVTVRDAALTPLSPARGARSVVSARLDPPGHAVRLWPAGDPGRFVADVRAPSEPGTYSLIVRADGFQAETPLVVAAAPAHAKRDERDVVNAFVRAQGGRTVAEASLGGLPGLLRTAVQPTHRVETWHPMRSAWWILPFAFALGGEWWLRRRRGHP